MRSWRAMAAVGATYAYFLLFAQFGFLELLRQKLAGPGEVRMAMAAMGVAGLAASLASGFWLGRRAAAQLVRAGFLACAGTGLLAVAPLGRTGLLVLSALIGGATAVLTVALASALPGLMPGAHRGLRVGIATGAAYALCNAPPVFEAPPSAQALGVAALCGLGWALTRSLPAGAAPVAGSGGRTSAAARGELAAVLLSFLALVWIDSAAFAIIQESAALKTTTWGSPSQTLALAGVHLAAAILAGAWIDRGRLRSLLPAACGLFVVAFPLMEAAPPWRGWGGPLYAAGISLYSVALVLWPGFGARREGVVPPRWRAALVFGVAGWLGSGLGVGMAQELHAIPRPFLAAAGAAVLGSWLVARPGALTARFQRLAQLYGPAAAWALVGAALTAAWPGLGVSAPVGEAAAPGVAGDPAGTAAIERGRRVYVAEGCINCHSQLLRAGTRDEELWGPYRPPERDASPVLIGNRRQGPDLANAGNRRSAIWHRLHLESPERLSPGTRMPSYAHLFDGRGRGEDLVAYLGSLGRESAPRRFEDSLSLPLPEAASAGSAVAGAELYARHCAVCHGARGEGDGPLAPAVRKPAMNLRKGSFWLVPFGPGIGDVEAGIARVVRFGIPGTSMPGHEVFDARELADLTAFVQRLAAAPGPGGGAGSP